MLQHTYEPRNGTVGIVVTYEGEWMHGDIAPGIPVLGAGVALAVSVWCKLNVKHCMLKKGSLARVFGPPFLVD